MASNFMFSGTKIHLSQIIHPLASPLGSMGAYLANTAAFCLRVPLSASATLYEKQTGTLL